LKIGNPRPTRKHKRWINPTSADPDAFGPSRNRLSGVPRLERRGHLDSRKNYARTAGQRMLLYLMDRAALQVFARQSANGLLPA